MSSFFAGSSLCSTFTGSASGREHLSGTVERCPPARAEPRSSRSAPWRSRRGCGHRFRRHAAACAAGRGILRAARDRPLLASVRRAREWLARRLRVAGACHASPRTDLQSWRCEPRLRASGAASVDLPARAHSQRGDRGSLDTPRLRARTGLALGGRRALRRGRLCGEPSRGARRSFRRHRRATVFPRGVLSLGVRGERAGGRRGVRRCRAGDQVLCRTARGTLRDLRDSRVANRRALPAAAFALCVTAMLAPLQIPYARYASPLLPALAAGLGIALDALLERNRIGCSLARTPAISRRAG